MHHINNYSLNYPVLKWPVCGLCVLVFSHLCIFITVIFHDLIFYHYQHAAMRCIATAIGSLKIAVVLSNLLL